MSFNVWSEGIRQLRYAEYNYVHEVRKQFNRLLDLEMFYPELSTHPANQWAEEIYRLGFKNTHGGTCWVPYSGPFQAFLGFLRYEYEFNVWGGSSTYYKRGKYRYGDPHDRHGRYYRQGPHFRQHGVETKEEHPKAAWREHKRFRRDKNKHKGYRGYNAGPWGKRQVHRSNRAFVRQKMSAERFDEISQNVQDVVRCWWD